MPLLRSALLSFLLLPGAVVAQTQPSTTVGGYGEVTFTKPSTGSSVGDTRRVVLYLAHTFNDRISYHSELEVEHGRLEAGGTDGELEMEQAFLDYRVSDALTIRTGLVLIPVGIINETHEPATFNGVDRPLVDQAVLPSTWREIGVGALGRFGQGFSWRAYLVNGLKAEGFSAEEGIREGRQEGQLASFASLGLTGRLEWARPGLKLGVSTFYGGTADTVASVGTGAFAAAATVLSADARWDRGPWTARAEVAHVALADADKIESAFGNGVAKRIFGAYLEGGYNLLSTLAPTSTARLDLFARVEKVNTQAAMPSGSPADATLDRTLFVTGLTFRPVSSVAFKADWQSLQNRADAGEGYAFDLGIGFQF
jgi:hypothetical protein